MAQPKKMSPFNFISLDGPDADGKRAEVYVQKNKGTIKHIDTTKLDKGVADVHFNVQGLTRPVHGWINADTDTFRLAQTALENNEEVTFRIESQRKAGVDPDIPMSELRADSNTAQQNVKTILVGINNVYTEELLTNPEEDAIFAGGNGRRPAATGNPAAGRPGVGGAPVNMEAQLAALANVAKEGVVRQEILDAMIAQVLLNGAAPDVVFAAVNGKDRRDDTQPPLQSAFSVEAAGWKEYNSDGRVNLGSGKVAAAVGIETLLVEQLRELIREKLGEVEVTNFDDTVVYYLDILLSICDRVQMLAYGDGFRPDRAASSHTRIRGIMYELLKKEARLPIEFNLNADDSYTILFHEAAHQEWVRFLGSTGLKRFKRAADAALRPTNFRVPVPASLRGADAAEERTEAPAPVSAPVENNYVQEPADLEPDMPEPEPVYEPEPAVEANPEPQPEPEVTSSPVADMDKTDTSAFYNEGHLEPEDVEGEEKATEATLKRLANLFVGSGFNLKDQQDMARVSDLLRMTFGPGYGNPRAIPDVILEDFIDHYESFGTQVLHSAIEYAVGMAN